MKERAPQKEIQNNEFSNPKAEEEIHSQILSGKTCFWCDMQVWNFKGLCMDAKWLSWALTVIAFYHFVQEWLKQELRSLGGKRVFPATGFPFLILLPCSSLSISTLSDPRINLSRGWHSVICLSSNFQHPHLEMKDSGGMSITTPWVIGRKKKKPWCGPSEINLKGMFPPFLPAGWGMVPTKHSLSTTWSISLHGVSQPKDSLIFSSFSHTAPSSSHSYCCKPLLLLWATYVTWFWGDFTRKRARDPKCWTFLCFLTFK